MNLLLLSFGTDVCHRRSSSFFTWALAALTLAVVAVVYYRRLCARRVSPRTRWIYALECREIVIIVDVYYYQSHIILWQI